MAIELTLEDQQLLADTVARAHSSMAPRERVAELLSVATLWELGGAPGLVILGFPGPVGLVHGARPRGQEPELFSGAGGTVEKSAHRVPPLRDTRLLL